MYRRASTHFVGVLSLLALLAGCQAEHPLDPEPLVDVDGALIGTWRCLTAQPEEADADASTVVVAAVSRREYWLTTIDPEDDDLSHYQMYPSIVGDDTLLNVREAGDESVYPWRFFSYFLPRPTVLLVQTVAADTIAGDTPAMVRQTVKKAMESTDFYEDFLVCVRVPSELDYLSGD